MNNTMTVSATTLQDCLHDNNRFSNHKLTADQIGADNLREWTKLVEDLRSASYAVFAFCENSDLSVESKSVDKTPVYNALREILSVVGEVKGHKLYANEELATLMVGYAGKEGTKRSPELQFCLSQLRNRREELKKSENVNGVNPDYIKNLEKEIAELEEKKSALEAQPDNKVSEPTRMSATTFRLKVEHRLARVIDEQKAKTWEELEAEAEARKQARKEAAKARKQAKKAEEATK